MTTNPRTPSSSRLTTSALATDVPERVRLLSPAGQAAYIAYRHDGDSAALDPLIFALLEAHLPRTLDQPIASLPRDTLLMDGLGFDSLAITEVVFFTEDLFGLTISNEEIFQVRTIEDLCGFVRQKIAVR